MPAGNKLTFVKSQPLSLAGHADYDEAWLERLIKSDTAILGLGSIQVISSQIQQSKGRLDLLLRDETNEVIYVVELMLGPLDESHIVRTVEYWLRERDRKSHEDYELVAVLAAEKVLESRFVDVVRFLSRQMPLLLMEVSALQVESHLTLKFIKVFDGRRLEGEAISPAPEASRESWIDSASPETVSLAEKLVDMLKGIDPSISLTFKQDFLGLRLGNRANNFMTFQPRRRFLRVWARTVNAVAFARSLKDAGIELLAGCDEEWIHFRITLPQFEQSKELLKAIAQASYQERQAL